VGLACRHTRSGLRINSRVVSITLQCSRHPPPPQLLLLEQEGDTVVVVLVGAVVLQLEEAVDTTDAPSQCSCHHLYLQLQHA
jgi:hypothetical protein